MSVSLHQELNENSNANIQFLAINKNPISITPEPLVNEDGDYIKGKNLLAITPEYTCIGTVQSVKILAKKEMQDFVLHTVLADNDKSHSISSIGKDFEFNEVVLDVRAIKFDNDHMFVVVLIDGSVYLIFEKEGSWTVQKENVILDIEDINLFSTVYRLSQNELVFLNKNKQLSQLILTKKEEYGLKKVEILPDYTGIVDFEYKKDFGLVFISETDLYISKDLTAEPRKTSLEELELDSKDFYKVQFISDKCISVSYTTLDVEQIEEELDFDALETTIITFDDESITAIEANLVAEADSIIPDAYNVITTSLKEIIPQYDYVTVLGTSKSPFVQILTINKKQVLLEQCFEDQYNICLPMSEEGDDTTVKGLSFSLWNDFKDELSKHLECEVDVNTPILYVLSSDLKLFAYFLVFVDNFKNKDFSTQKSIELLESGLLVNSDIEKLNNENFIEKEEVEIIESPSSKYITEDGQLKPPTKVEIPENTEEKKSGLFSSMSNIIKHASKSPVFGQTNDNPFASSNNKTSPFGDFGKNITLGSGSAFGKPQFSLLSKENNTETEETKKDTSNTAFSGFNTNISPFAQLTSNNNNEVKNSTDVFGKLPEKENKPVENPFAFNSVNNENPFSSMKNTLSESPFVGLNNSNSGSKTSLNFSNVKDIPLPTLANKLEIEDKTEIFEDSNKNDDKIDNTGEINKEDKLNNEGNFNVSYATINTSGDIDEGNWVEVGDEKSIYQIDESRNIIEESEEVIEPLENEDIASDQQDFEEDSNEFEKRGGVEKQFIITNTATTPKDVVSRGSQVDSEIFHKSVQTPDTEYTEASVIADEKELSSEVLNKAYKYPEIEKMYVVDEKAIWDHKDEDRNQGKEGVFEMMSKMVHLVDNHLIALNMNIKILDKTVKEHQKFTYEKNGIETVKNKNVNWRLSEINKINEILDVSFNNQVLSLKKVQDMDVNISDIIKESLFLKHEIKKSISDLEIQLKTQNVVKLSNIEEGLLFSHDAMIQNIQTKLKIVEKNLFLIKMYLATKKSVQVNDITSKDVEAFLNDNTETSYNYDCRVIPFGCSSNSQKSRLRKKTEIFNRRKQSAQI